MYLHFTLPGTVGKQWQFEEQSPEGNVAAQGQIPAGERLHLKPCRGH